MTVDVDHTPAVTSLAPTRGPTTFQFGSSVLKTRSW